MCVCLYSPSSHAVGEKIIDSVIRSDFVFDRNISNVPFLPLAFVQYSNYGDSRFEDCLPYDTCDLYHDEFSQALVLPVWVGQKNMFLVGDTINLNWLEFENQKTRVDSFGLILGWIQQPTTDWQWGGFLYPIYHSTGSSNVLSDADEVLGGVIARYRYSPRFHTWFGMVADVDKYDSVYYPYLGFDWLIGREWAVSLIPPWPTVTYAPGNDWLYKAGLLPGSTNWEVAGESDINSSFSYWNAGFGVERRIKGDLWLELTGGVSGLAKFSVTSGGETVFENDLDQSPFWKIALNYRPSGN